VVSARKNPQHRQPADYISPPVFQVSSEVDPGSPTHGHVNEGGTSSTWVERQLDCNGTFWATGALVRLRGGES
jgi:hypothetical protein